MSNSTTTLDLVSSSQAQKEVTVNAAIDAASPATLFGRRASTTSALTWGFFGGTINVDGVLTQISNGTLALSASTTNYVEATRAGVVSKNTTGFTPGSIPLYTIVTGTATVTSYLDYRAWASLQGISSRAAVSMASDANLTLTATQARCDILDITSAVSLAATRDIVLPINGQWTVYNGTTGAQSLQFIGATGTGITVANGKRAIIYADGVNIVRVTSDV